MTDLQSFALSFGAFWLGLGGYIAWLWWRARRPPAA